jgi:putative two-component system response regulator
MLDAVSGLSHHAAREGSDRVIDETAQRILVVDDNRGTARLLEQVLVAEGHRVTVAGDGVEALARIAECHPDLILLDLDLPILSGYEVCRHIKENPATRWIPIIIITGQAASEFKLQCWELGADDFLAKPFQCVEVVARCRSLLRAKRLVDELDSAEAVVFAFARAVEAKSPYTHGHAERVRDYALLLAAQVGVADDEWETLRKGALLHDIGKISVPDAILDKPGALSAEEFEIVKQHTVQGAHIVEPLRSIRKVIPLIRSHHERCDGRGYPDGLRAHEIPRSVSILSIADVYDALATPRPYRPAMAHATCLEILRSNAAGGGLDPDLVKLFCKLMDDGPPGSIAGKGHAQESCAETTTSEASASTPGEGTYSASTSQLISL